MAYIYTHETDAGEIFYVGKGTGDRAYKMEGHNPYWERTVAKHGKVVRILEDDLTDEVAFAKEVALIEEIGLDMRRLFSQIDLGEVSTSMTIWKDPAYRKMMSEQNKKTKPCPNCGKQLNAGNMARHLKAKANTCRG